MKSKRVFYEFRGKFFAFIATFLGGAVWAFVGLPRKLGALCALMHALAIASWVLVVMSLVSITIGMKSIMFERRLRVNRDSLFIEQSKGFALRGSLFNDEGLEVRKRLIINIFIFVLAFVATLGSVMIIDKLSGVK